MKLYYDWANSNVVIKWRTLSRSGEKVSICFSGKKGLLGEQNKRAQVRETNLSQSFPGCRCLSVNRFSSKGHPTVLLRGLMSSPPRSWHSKMKQLLSVDLLLLDQIRQKSVPELMASVHLRCFSGSKSLNSLQKQTTTTHAICSCVMKMIAEKWLILLNKWFLLLSFSERRRKRRGLIESCRWLLLLLELSVHH
jgi:hypothetical protein